MSALGQVSQISTILGDAFQFANSFLQPQVSITNKEPIPGLTFSLPAKGKNTVIMEVIDTEDMTLSVNITDKPVADLGAAIDYVSRNPPRFTLSGLISNRNLDVLANPTGFLLSKAASAAPQVASAINQASTIANEFFDLGGDEIDNKIKQFYIWMNNAVYVYPIGVRLNINNWIQDNELINWLIDDVTLRSDLDAGDGVGIDVSFRGLIGISDQKINKHGSKLQEARQRARTLGGLNPFGGV